MALLALVFVGVLPQVAAVRPLVLVNMTQRIHMLTSPYFTQCDGYCSINKKRYTNTRSETDPLEIYAIYQQADLQNKVWPINPKYIGAISNPKTNTTVVAVTLILTGQANINPFYGTGLAVNWTKTDDVDHAGNYKSSFYFKHVELGETLLPQICLYDCLI